IVVPGGFSFGDYLRSGAMAARSPIMAAVAERAKAGVPGLGICHGFQGVAEGGLLPGALMRNGSLRFGCRAVFLRVECNDNAFTRGYRTKQVVRFPVAHHDGNYVTDDDTLARLEDEGRVAFRYVDAAGEVTAAANPNGSRNNIAGILSESGSVLGMM